MCLKVLITDIRNAQTSRLPIRIYGPNMHPSKARGCCMFWREGIPAPLPNREIAFSGQKTSCCQFERWTFLSVQSLGLCLNTRETDCVWGLLGKTACSQVTTAMHARGVQTAAGDTVDGLHPREMRHLHCREPSPRAYSHQQDLICALSRCPGICLAMHFLCS